ncbi:unnamed protein product, partial [Scytosiphon promiscuus]
GPGSGSGGDAVPGNGGSGGNTAPGAAVGADIGCQGGNRRRDGGHPRAGAAVVGAEAVPRERLPPLAPIPRLGAFPAQHLVDGTAKGNGSQLANGGSKRAGFRTVAGPSARADPSPRRADADAPSPSGVRAAAAAAVPAAGSGREGAVPGAAGVVAGGASARSQGYSRRKSDAGGSLSPPAAAGGDESAETEGTSSAEAQRRTEPDGKAGGVRGKGQERTAGVVKTEAQLPAAAALSIFFAACFVGFAVVRKNLFCRGQGSGGERTKRFDALFLNASTTAIVASRNVLSFLCNAREAFEEEKGGGGDEGRWMPRPRKRGLPQRDMCVLSLAAPPLGLARFA